MNNILKHSYYRFALVGGIGFLVDLSSLMLLSQYAPYTIARGLSFWVAASSNWWWNRHFTFSNNRHKKTAVVEWLQFLSGSLLAFIPNLGVYLLLIHIQPWIHDHELRAIWPYFAMIPGVAIGLCINYSLSRYWVFRDRQITPQKP
ncbi:GtrA family protein [Marinomonas sp. TW1]|uniref:GtrA family protein n=1 Tax=Marinomonas sp. TW1 TaxID=1561203 RepID=UPI0007AF58DF|nr:GtrA family protein [Marinomonas sp. TW1]KZN15437.1 polysaccharide synthesis protein GtrA [Marinomonas sp. TW1]